MKNAKKVLSVLAVILFVFAMTSSALLTAAEATHICNGDDCYICSCIQNCTELLRLISTGASLCTFMLFSSLFTAAVLFKACGHNKYKNPVTLKIKLLN